MAQRVAGIGRRMHVEALLGQRLGQQFAEQRLVFHQQDGRFLFHRVSSAGAMAGRRKCFDIAENCSTGWLATGCRNSVLVPAANEIEYISAMASRDNPLLGLTPEVLLKA